MSINAGPINRGPINSSIGLVVKTTVSKPLINSRDIVCTITGAADSLDDLTVPISSISLRMDDAGLSSLSVTCNNGAEYADDITARSNGGIIITTNEYYTDGTTDQTIAAEYPITSLNSYQGGKNFSVSLTGRVELQNFTTKKVPISGASFISTDELGNLRVRCDLDKDLLPKDTAILEDGAEIVVVSITQTITSKLMVMEITDG